MRKLLKWGLVICVVTAPIYFLTTTGLDQILDWTQGYEDRSGTIETTYDVGKVFLWTGRYEEAARTFHRLLKRYRRDERSTYPWKRPVSESKKAIPEKAKDLLPYAQFYYAQSLQNEDKAWTNVEALREYKDFLDRYPSQELRPEAQNAVFFLQHIRKVQGND